MSNSSKMSRNEQKFSLKDHLFNKAKVEKIAAELQKAHPAFEKGKFIQEVVSEFPKLELMERIYHIRDILKKYLPSEYEAAVTILKESLPPPCDPTKTDDDFGDFIYAPYGYFVAEYGLEKKNLKTSLGALKELTTRFSVEGPIRFFINTYPKETYAELRKWTKDTHYHVRRAASEGTRPFLPWAKKIEVDFKDAVCFLDALYGDKTRFVTRSVANHVNDISKIDADAAVQLLKRWQKEGKQEAAEMAFITRHALRTLIKQGNKKALAMLGYDGGEIEVKKCKIETPKVEIGETLTFSFDIVSKSKKKQELMIDYILYFKKANGKLAPKAHKIAKKSLKAGETLHIEKNHPLRVMTTRKLYPGKHEVELQINGKTYGKKSFELTQ